MAIKLAPICFSLSYSRQLFKIFFSTYWFYWYSCISQLFFTLFDLKKRRGEKISNYLLDTVSVRSRVIHLAVSSAACCLWFDTHIMLCFSLAWRKEQTFLSGMLLLRCSATISSTFQPPHCQTPLHPIEGTVSLSLLCLVSEQRQHIFFFSFVRRRLHALPTLGRLFWEFVAVSVGENLMAARISRHCTRPWPWISGKMDVWKDGRKDWPHYTRAGNNTK